MKEERDMKHCCCLLFILYDSWLNKFGTKQIIRMEFGLTLWWDWSRTVAGGTVGEEDRASSKTMNEANNISCFWLQLPAKISNEMMDEVSVVRSSNRGIRMFECCSCNQQPIDTIEKCKRHCLLAAGWCCYTNTSKKKYKILSKFVRQHRFLPKNDESFEWIFLNENYVRKPNFGPQKEFKWFNINRRQIQWIERIKLSKQKRYREVRPKCCPCMGSYTEVGS